MPIRLMLICDALLWSQCQAKTFADASKTSSSAKEAAASSNEVIVRVLADETQRQQLGPLDPLKLALAQIYVLKASASAVT